MTNRETRSRRSVLKGAGLTAIGAASVYGFTGSASATDTDSSSPSGGEISTAESCNSLESPCDWIKQDQEYHNVPGGRVLVTLVNEYWFDQDPFACTGEGQDTFRFEENSVSLVFEDGASQEVENAEIKSTYTIEGNNIEVTWPPVFDTTSDNSATIISEFGDGDLDDGAVYQNVGEIEEETDCKWLNQDAITGGEVETTVTLDFGSSTETFFADTSVSGL